MYLSSTLYPSLSHSLSSSKSMASSAIEEETSERREEREKEIKQRLMLSLAYISPPCCPLLRSPGQPVQVHTHREYRYRAVQIQYKKRRFIRSSLVLYILSLSYIKLQPAFSPAAVVLNPSLYACLCYENSSSLSPLATRSLVRSPLSLTICPSHTLLHTVDAIVLPHKARSRTHTACHTSIPTGRLLIQSQLQSLLSLSSHSESAAIRSTHKDTWRECCADCMCDSFFLILTGF